MKKILIIGSTEGLRGLIATILERGGYSGILRADNATGIEMAEQFFPGVPITRELEEHEALFSNRKIREVLGFKEQHNWRKYVKGE